MPGTVLGLVAGSLSALAYGSFAVPIKAPSVVEAKVHPLVFQSYKSLMCFLSSFLVLLWADFRFTWWATLAALIWVTNGVLAIISIHLAGLGVAQTIWSSVSVFVSFAWGKLYFREPIADVPLTMAGLLLMVLGMVGLGWVASQADTSSKLVVEPQTVAAAVVSEIFSGRTTFAVESPAGSPGKAAGEEEESKRLVTSPHRSASDLAAAEEPHVNSSQPYLESASPLAEPLEEGQVEHPAKHTDMVVLERQWHRHRFELGVAGSVCIGVLAGSMMVCLKLSPSDRQGDQYTVSFGIGVLMVTAAALAAYFSACRCLERQGPSFQVKVAAGPACLAGILWSIGNYLSIVAVAHLGMAIGWPLVQCSLIVSNLWALFWYKEIQGTSAIILFLCSALVIIAGVFMLAWFGL